GPPPASISRRRSFVSSLSRICFARFCRSCCSSLKSKSISMASLAAGRDTRPAAARSAACDVRPSSAAPPSPRRERHAETEHRDEIALDLVGAAAEGEDDEPAVLVLEPGRELDAG